MEIPQSFAWAEEMLTNPLVKSANTVLLYSLLASASKETGSAQIQASNKDLAQMLHSSERTVQRLLIELEHVGYISISVSNGHQRAINVLTPTSVAKGASSMTGGTSYDPPFTPSSVTGGTSYDPPFTPSSVTRGTSSMTGGTSSMAGSQELDLKSVTGDLQSTAKELKKYVGELKGCLASVRRQARQGGSQAGAITVPADDHYSGPMPSSKDYEEILTYLNEKAGKRFRVDSENTKYIDGRWKKGFRVPDFKRVIDNKCTEWLHTGKRFSDGTPAEFYLRPKTLFSEKNFENYLNQTPVDEYGNPITSAAFGQSKLDREIIERKRQREQERQQHRS